MKISQIKSRGVKAEITITDNEANNILNDLESLNNYCRDTKLLINHLVRIKNGNKEVK